MKKPHVWVFIVLLVTYIILSLTAPIDPETIARYEVSATALRLLNLTVLTPLIAVFLFAFYGFVHFKNYAASVRDTKEGPHLNNIANGLMVLAYSLVLNSIIGSVASYVEQRRPSFQSGMEIVQGYIAVGLMLLAMVLIARGASGLYSSLKKRKENPAPSYWLLGPIALACLYSYLLVNQGDASSSGDIAFIPDWLAVTTLAIPYVFGWCIGIIAALQLNRYKNRVKGKLYRPAMGYLSIGIATIVAISVLIRFITTLSEQLSQLNLTPVLLIVYLLVAFYAFGFGMVARGAKRLRQMEEV